jgi:hypothetical protein
MITMLTLKSKHVVSAPVIFTRSVVDGETSTSLYALGMKLLVKRSELAQKLHLLSLVSELE